MISYTPSPQRGRCSVAVPSNVREQRVYPGTAMNVRAPSSRTRKVTVPAGVYVGAKFEFEYD